MTEARGESKIQNPKSKSEGASLILPAYNERNRIEGCLRSVADWARTRPGGWDWEVILVDDGSSDATLPAARQLAAQLGLPLEILRHEENRGKGAAIRTGVLASSGNPVLVSDVDLSTPLTEWIKLAERLPSHPVAIGSRGLGEDLVRLKQPFHRRLLGKAGNLLVRLLAVPGIRDTQCGFKLFRADIAHDVFAHLSTDGFGYDPEVLYRAKKHGVRIVEVPVVWRNSAPTKVAPFSSSFDMFRHVLRIRFRG